MNMTHPFKNPVLSWIKDCAGAVGTLHSTLSGTATAAVNGAMLAMTSSAIMRAFMISGGILGCLIGYFVAASVFRKRAKTKRFKWGIGLLISFIVLAGIGILFLAMLGPDLAKEYSWVDSFRTFFITAHPFENLAMAAVSGLSGFCLVAGIAVLSPELS